MERREEARGKLRAEYLNGEAGRLLLVDVQVAVLGDLLLALAAGAGAVGRRVRGGDLVEHVELRERDVQVLHEVVLSRVEPALHREVEVLPGGCALPPVAHDDLLAVPLHHFRRVVVLLPRRVPERRVRVRHLHVLEPDLDARQPPERLRPIRVGQRELVLRKEAKAYP